MTDVGSAEGRILGRKTEFCVVGVKMGAIPDRYLGTESMREAVGNRPGLESHFGAVCSEL